MKKLMIALAAVAMAMGAQAAAANWQVSANNMFNGAGVDAVRYTGTAYIFDAVLYTQDGIFNSFSSGTDITQSAVSNTGVAITSGTIATSSAKFTYGEQGSAYSYFFAVIEGDNLYLSKSTAMITANTTSTAKTVGFGSQAPTTGASSKDLPYDVSTVGAVTLGAWNVPEPTSGLMMLLGMGALALRRRRA